MQTNAVKYIQLETDKMSVMAHQKEKGIFLKVNVSSPKHVSKLRSIIDENTSLISTDFTGKTYESNMPYNLRFMIDNSLNGM